jgi:hypothetical protein
VTETLLFYVGLILIASIPLDSLLPLLALKVKEVNDKLDKPRVGLFLPITPFLFGIGKVIQFLKGYFALYFTSFYLGDGTFMIVSCILLLTLNNWSPFLKFRNQKKFGYVLWGCYTYIFPYFGLVYPVVFVFFTGVLNSFPVGYTLTIISMFFALAYIQADAYYLPLNFALFVVVFLSLSPQLIQHIEGKKWTLFKSFQNRV